MQESKIYIKRLDEPPIPVTARIEWLASGRIKPCFFWTANGSCYEVKHVYEAVQMAHLRESGVGLRFKIKAEACSDDEHGQFETYLYFADDWFCGRDIIDARYGHAGKEYIPVTLDVFPDCEYEIIDFCVKGELYTVGRTVAIEPRGSFSAGGVGVWHKVEACLLSDDNDTIPKVTQRMAALYFEINKWFVSVASG